MRPALWILIGTVGFASASIPVAAASADDEAAPGVITVSAAEQSRLVLLDMRETPLRFDGKLASSSAWLNEGSSLALELARNALAPESVGYDVETDPERLPIVRAADLVDDGGEGSLHLLRRYNGFEPRILDVPLEPAQPVEHARR